MELDATIASAKFAVTEWNYRCMIPSGACTEFTTDVAALGAIDLPDGRHGMLTRDGHLWLRDLNSGAERAGKLLPPLGSYWSLDSVHVIVSRVDQRHAAPCPCVEFASDSSQVCPNATEVSQSYLASDGEREAALLKGKLMIIVGGLDQNELPASTLKLVNALLKANKEVDLLLLLQANQLESRNSYTVRATHVRSFFDEPTGSETTAVVS
jgi:hypothetical protein